MEKLPAPANDPADALPPSFTLPPADARPSVAPRDALETEIVRIWQDLLDVSPIGIDDNFFELGGHSLIAPAMVSRVSETFDRAIPLSLLLENPTVAGFADALIRAVPANASGVVTVRAEGTRPPLFFLHGDFNSGGFYCGRLARGLTDQPFYALAPLGSGTTQDPASIEDMAAQHGAAIRQTRPHGPYVLGGHCNGALEALEIARQLREDGHQVPAVILIEPPIVDTRLRAVDVPVRAAARVAGLDEWQRVDMFLRVYETLQQIARQPGSSPSLIYRKLRTLLNRAKPSAPSDAALVLQAAAPLSFRHDEAMWRRYMRAVAAYVPRPYDGSAAVFTADEIVRSGLDPSVAWRRVGRRFEFHVVPGGHFSCIGAHVASTSAAIDAYLRSALSR